jgi:hypothetical protein
MKNILKILLLLFIVGIIAGTGVYFYVFHKPHRNLAKEKAVASISADSLLLAFEKNETKANASYLDKAIEVTGLIDEITANKNTYTINLKVENVDFGGIKCTLDSTEVTKVSKIKPGQTISLKGQCTGWLNDADLGINEVSLTSCFFQ